MERACAYLITGGSWGLQMVGRPDLVMLVMNQKGMDHLLSSKFKMVLKPLEPRVPSAVVSGNTDWKLRAEMLTYSARADYLPESI
jgi:hypothetical protein